MDILLEEWEDVRDEYVIREKPADAGNERVDGNEPVHELGPEVAFRSRPLLGDIREVPALIAIIQEEAHRPDERTDEEDNRDRGKKCPAEIARPVCGRLVGKDSGVWFFKKIKICQYAKSSRLQDIRLSPEKN